MPALKRLRPMLAVNSIPETIAFYRDTLGFKAIGMWGEEPDKPLWCEVERNDVQLMFTWSEPHQHEGEDELHHHEPALEGALYINVDDVDALFDEIKGKVDKFDWEPADMPYGNRDFALRDPNGFQLIFGQPIEASEE